MKVNNDNKMVGLISFCNGNDEAIAEIYKNWLPELYFIAYRYLRNREEAEDCVSDCFEKLLKLPLKKRRQKFIEDKIDLKSLMIVMVKNRSLDKLKVSKNRNRLTEGIEIFWSNFSQNDSKKTFLNENFEMMLNCLPEKERKILKMNIEGYKHEEIGEELNISEKTISNLLSISRKRIKSLWEIFM